MYLQCIYINMQLVVICYWCILYQLVGNSVNLIRYYYSFDQRFKIILKFCNILEFLDLSIMKKRDEL